MSAAAARMPALGCRPGDVTAHLHRLRLSVFGVDLSPAMVASARREYPDLRFQQGSMTALDVADGDLAGIVAWYSIIHISAERLPGLFAEFHRVPEPGGYLLLAFQIGERPLHLSHAFGQDVSLVAYRWPPGRVADLLRQAGFHEVARLIRRPDGEGEKVERGYVIASRGL